jgi:hypothetical protein
MADEQLTPASAPAPAPEAPEAAPAVPEAPGGAPPAEEWGARFARLEDQLAREREQRAALEGTLRLLAPQPPQQQGPMPLVRLPRDQALRIAATLGGQWTEEAVQSHAPIFAAFMQELAAPLLMGLEGMADTVDLIQVRQDVPQYETQAEEADRVRLEYRQRGQVITRKQAVALVKARRMDDPKYVDTLVEARAKERATDQASRAAAAGAAVTEGGSSAQKAGPEPTKQPRVPVTREEFARMTLEEKRKALEGATL